MQDPDQLVQSSAIKKTANVVTDMDAFVNYLIKGGKRKTPTKRKTATKSKTVTKRKTGKKKNIMMQGLFFY